MGRKPRVTPLLPTAEPVGVGKPPYEPLPEHRRMVESMAAVGITHDQMAAVLGIGRHALEKHFRSELDLGAVKATINVAGALYAMATVPPGQATGANVAAAIFWMKARAGWREKHSIETLDENGNPITPTGPQTFVLKVER